MAQQVDTGASGRRSTTTRRSPAGSADLRELARRAYRLGTRPEPWRRGLVTAALALLLGLVMLLHASIPNRIGNLGSLVETFLPWLGVFAPVLLAVALYRRSVSAPVALLLPVMVWLNLFGGLLTDKSSGPSDLTLTSHNVDAGNTDPARTAQDLAGSGSDVLALQELTPAATRVYARDLANAYPYHSVQGTVGVWSKLPLSGTKPVDIKLGWTRALRTTVATDDGPMAVYVAHLPSVRVKLDAGFTAGRRDASANALGDAIAAERVPRVVLLGDLNGTMNDRALADITAQMRSAQGAAGDGFGFSWPASFPMARIDQILVRGVEPVNSWVMAATGSDHRPVAASVKF